MNNQAQKATTLLAETKLIKNFWQSSSRKLFRMRANIYGHHNGAATFFRQIKLCQTPCRAMNTFISKTAPAYIRLRRKKQHIVMS